MGSGETSTKQPKQGCKGHYHPTEQAARTAPTLIRQVITGLSALCEVFITITTRLALLCGMFWLYKFIILSLLGLY